MDRCGRRPRRADPSVQQYPQLFTSLDESFPKYSVAQGLKRRGREILDGRIGTPRCGFREAGSYCENDIQHIPSSSVNDRVGKSAALAASNKPYRMIPSLCAGESLVPGSILRSVSYCDRLVGLLQNG